MTLEELFCQKHTENGDLSFTKVSNNNLLNILFLTEYYQKHLEEVHIGTSDIEQLFSMFIRDPRFGLGKKDLGRTLMWKSKCPYYKVIKAGRWDDIYHIFDKLEKIALSCIPIVDTSGSMCNSNDSLGKALAIGHYLAKCSTYAPNKVISFSSHPQLITLGTPIESRFRRRAEIDFTSIYAKEIDSMITGDCSNTDFGAVLELLKGLNKWPEYLVVLSDMEFDQGSNKKKDEVEQMFEERGINTKIIWWNLNARNITCPEMDNKGNIFLSGYSPMLLKYLQVGFNGEMFLNILLEEYKKNINY